MNGLKRYNEIQKALSSYKKESGVKFIAGFHHTASQLYRSTKQEPLKFLVQNIDEAYKNLIPELPSEAFTGLPFFNYEDIATAFPMNLQIRSKQLHGDKWQSEIPEYEVVFKDFADYCNENNGIFWQNSKDAPRFLFSPIDYDDADGVYFAELSIDREDAYGYEPGMGAVENLDVPASDIKPDVDDMEPEEVEEPETKGKKTKELKPEPETKEVKKIKAETEKTKAETERIKASKQRLTELNKGIKNLDSMLKRKLISKKEYKQYLKKLMDL